MLMFFLPFLSRSSPLFSLLTLSAGWICFPFGPDLAFAGENFDFEISAFKLLGYRSSGRLVKKLNISLQWLSVILLVNAWTIALNYALSTLGKAPRPLSYSLIDWNKLWYCYLCLASLTSHYFETTSLKISSSLFSSAFFNASWKIL